MVEPVGPEADGACGDEFGVKAPLIIVVPALPVPVMVHQRLLQDVLEIVLQEHEGGVFRELFEERHVLHHNRIEGIIKEDEIEGRHIVRPLQHLPRFQTPGVFVPAPLRFREDLQKAVIDHLLEFHEDILDGLVMQVKRLAVDVCRAGELRDRDVVDRLGLDQAEKGHIDVLFGTGHSAVHRHTSSSVSSGKPCHICFQYNMFLLKIRRFCGIFPTFQRTGN